MPAPLLGPEALAAYHDTTGFDCGHPALDTFLAVERSEQGAGLGEALLKDAIKRHLQAQSIIGSRALVAHAKDERAAAFYARYRFQPSPTDPLHLVPPHQGHEENPGAQVARSYQ